MAMIDLANIKTVKELEEIARRNLEGKTLKEVMKEIVETDSSTRVTTKSDVGYVIENGYFGIGKNSTAGPDIPHLGVEVKTSPLKFLKNGKLQVKEPLSLNIINYSEEYKKESIKDSSFYKKNRMILLIWYVHDKKKPRSEYLIKYVFLWEMTDSVLDELKDDYRAIQEKIKEGDAHNFHQSDHKNLTLCPKHNGDYKDPNERTSKTPQPFNSIPAQVRAFRLKSAYMSKVIGKYLDEKHPGLRHEFS